MSSRLMSTSAMKTEDYIFAVSHRTLLSQAPDAALQRIVHWGRTRVYFDVLGCRMLLYCVAEPIYERNTETLGLKLSHCHVLVLPQRNESGVKTAFILEFISTHNMTFRQLPSVFFLLWTAHAQESHPADSKSNIRRCDLRLLGVPVASWQHMAVFRTYTGHTIRLSGTVLTTRLLMRT